MLTRLLRVVLASLVGCTFGLQLAHAEIYTWVDSSGKVNLSNLAPPEGVRVTRVTHEPAPKIAMAADAAREAARQAEMEALSERARDLEVQVLSERVRQLEHEVELSRSQVPQATAYPSVPAQPVVQYIDEPPPPASAGCDPTWMGCGFWWNSGIYPATVVVVGAPNFRRFHSFRGGQHVALQGPLRLPEPLNLFGAPPATPRGRPHRR